MTSATNHYTTLVATTLLLLAACAKPQPKQYIEQLLPYTLLNPSAQLTFDPNVEQPNGQIHKLSEILRQFQGKTTTVLLWASWCPPDASETIPNILLSIDQNTDAWKLAIEQINLPTTTLHGRIDPYQSKNFLDHLRVHGIPYTLHFNPQGAYLPPSINQ